MTRDLRDQIARWRSIADLDERAGAPVANALREAIATVERAYAFAEEMRTYCSPHGVAADYANRLEAVLGESA
jgi:hypothetical protein